MVIDRQATGLSSGINLTMLSNARVSSRGVLPLDRSLFQDTL